MKNYFTTILALILVASILSACSDEGKNVNGQKQIEFSVIQEGGNENWKVKDKVTGTYLNIENIIYSNHNVILSPNSYSGESVNVSFKVNGEVLDTNRDTNKKEVFTADRAHAGHYTLEQKDLMYFDDNEKLLDEEMQIVIEYGDKKDTITLE